jgi:hypothetical protein
MRNRRSTAIAVQYCIYLSTAFCSRQELNECLTDRYVLAYVEVEFYSVRSFGANRDPKLTPKEPSTHIF